MLKELEKYFIPILILADCIIALIAFGLCMSASLKEICLIGHQYNPADFAAQLQAYSNFSNLSFLNLLLLTVFYPLVQLLYLSKTRVRFFSAGAIIFQVGKVILIMVALSIPLLAINANFKEDLYFIGIFLFILFSLSSLMRFFTGLLIKSKNGNDHLLKAVIIIGTGAKGRETAKQIISHPEWGMRVSGFLTMDKEKIGQVIKGLPVIAHLDDLALILKKYVVDCVLFEGDKKYLPILDYIRRRCKIEGLDFALTSPEPGLTQSDYDVHERLDGLSFLFKKSVKQDPVKLSLKRIFDFFASTILLCLSLPFFILIPFLIKRDTPGPVFFRQERVGKNGRRFIMYKFRSMLDGAEKLQAQYMHLNEMDGPAFKIKNDPRVTSVGYFLRKTSLDELPQLFNVFKGDISLVGPRPPVYQEVYQYRPWERKRLSVAQGITCLWQVSGRNEIKFDEWMKLDLLYIENWSLATDFKILLQTIPAVISRKGAQ